MKFIKPSEISSKVMTLLDESDEFVLIVSPYVKILRWYKLLKKLDNLRKREINLAFVIREDATNSNSFNELKELGINFSAIPDLHCKLYLNEKYAIVSSMNLLLSSEINSIELGYQTETDEEYQELKSFCERYLQIDFNMNNQSSENYQNNIDWRDLTYQILSNSLTRRFNINQENDSFTVNTGKNNYSSFIWNGKQNLLRISGVLTMSEFNNLSKNPYLIPDIEDIKIELIEGKNNHYNTIWGTMANPLLSKNLNEVISNEAHIIAKSVSSFILEVDKLK